METKAVVGAVGPARPRGEASLQLTVSDAIDAAPIGRLQVIVFALCILVSLLDGFDTQAIAFVAPAIARQWSISHFDFGFIFSATLLGSVIGSATGGMLADRMGRRRLVIASTALFGLSTGGCALVANYEQLLILRLICGLGMGAVIPNMMALTSEYAPERQRATIVTLTLWGFPFGAAVGGIAAGPLIALWGWRSVFWLGCAAPIILLPALIIGLPESLHFLGLTHARRDLMVALLRRIAPGRVEEVSFEEIPLNKEAEHQRGSAVALVRSKLALPTALLSSVMFLSLLLTYLLLNWVPTLLTQGGMPVSKAILGVVALNFGGIAGSYVLSRSLDRRSSPGVLLGVGYACATIAILVASIGAGNAQWAMSLLFVCGFFHIGSQLSTSAFSSGIYPVALRGTGIGLIQAIGRIGSLVGPIIGGTLLTIGFTTSNLLQLAVLPAGLCALLLFILSRRLKYLGD